MGEFFFLNSYKNYPADINLADFLKLCLKHHKAFDSADCINQGWLKGVFQKPSLKLKIFKPPR